MLLGDGKSIHIERWAIAMSEEFEIAIFSLRGFSENLERLDYIKKYSTSLMHSSWLNKLSYLKSLPLLKSSLKDFKPDILHAHYASSYGLLGRLSKYKPYVISCWGSDLFEFPNSSALTKMILKKNLKSADEILVSSICLQEELKKYSTKTPQLIYFGVESSKFPFKEKLSDGVLKIGVAKSLRTIYGVDRLLRVFKGLVLKNDQSFSLYIAGDGEQKQELLALAIELEIEKYITWEGIIPHDELASFYQKMDLAVFLSRAESFGVSAIEAMSVGTPVVTSNALGFQEVVKVNETGMICDINTLEEDLNIVCEVIEELILDKKNLNEMGVKAAEDVRRRFEWLDCVKKHADFYHHVLKN